MRRYTLAINAREFVVDVTALSADCFEVVVGGESYEVNLSGNERLNEATITPGLLPGTGPRSAATKTPARVRVEEESPAPSTPTPRKPSGGKGSLTAPMPGVILEVNVKAGDTVERGQQVAVLDAMKMHNIIGAPRAGTIAEVFIAAGQNVDHGDALIKYQED